MQDQRFEFLAHASHELRTPANGIVGMTSMLMDTPLNDEQKEYVRTIRACSESLLTVINDILDLAKISAGKISLESSRFSLTSVIEECMDMVAPMLGNKPICMYNTTSSEAPLELFGDPARLRQILCNLLSNAAKFTQEGFIAISASVTGDSAKPMLNVAVTDSGCGIPTDKMGLLFKPFSQIRRTSGERPQGSGLGLMISRQMARLMGGDLDVRSHEGRGSCFTLAIPAIRPASTSAASTARAPAIEKNCNVFLITRDPRLSEAVTTIVSQSLGYPPVHLPENGSASMDFLARQSGRFVFIVDETALRTKAPEPDSGVAALDFVTTLRKTYNFERTPVLLLKSHGWSKRRQFDDLDVSSIRRNPLKQSVLINYIRELAHQPPPGYNFRKDEQERRQRISHSFDKGKFNNARILVAEDNLINRKVMETILRKMGISADFAETGEEAVKAARSHSYPLIIMDCQMPEMNGFEATRAIRQLPAYRETPILALTADSLGEAKAEAQAAGMTEYLVKPVDIQKLHRLMQKYLMPTRPVRRASSLQEGGIRTES